MGKFRHILLKPKIPQEQLDTALIRLDSIRSGILNKRSPSRRLPLSFRPTRIPGTTKGIMVNNRPNSQNMGTPRFQLSELNQDIARVVGEMKVGEISEPFIMINDKGRQVAAMVKITNRNEGHKANINNDYQIIKQMAENARRQELMDEWLQKKIETIYVRIDPNWKGCDFKYKGWLK